MEAGKSLKYIVIMEAGKSLKIKCMGLASARNKPSIKDVYILFYLLLFSAYPKELWTRDFKFFTKIF